MGYPSFPSSEAKALHAAIDGDKPRALQAVADYSPTELRSTAQALEDLADWCRELAQGKADRHRCPRCGELADSVESRIDGPTRYRHGQLEHLDLTTDLKAH